MTTESMKPYPAYKDSGIEWIGEIPEGWEVKHLKHVVKLINEKTDDVHDCKFKIELENIESFTGKLLNNLGTFEGMGNRFKKGDVLFNKLRPYLCKVVLVPDDGISVGELLTFRTINSLSNKFLLYRLLSTDFISIVNGSTYGTKMPRASWEFIGNIKCPIPSLPEQQSIATFLDNQTSKIDTLIENKQKQIELLKEGRTAIINQAVTKGLNPDVPMRDSGIEWLGEIPEHWDVKPLFTVAHEQKTKNKSGFEKNVLSLSYGNIIRRDVESNFGLLPESFNTYQIVDSGNIILRLTDLQNDKRSLRVGLVKETGIITSAYVCLKVNGDYDPKCVYDLLHSYDLRKVFYTMGGGLRQTLRFEELKRLPMLCSPLQEQNEITTFLTHHANKIDTVVENSKKQITLLKEYRTALISEAVTGKIDLRNQHEFPTPK